MVSGNTIIVAFIIFLIIFLIVEMNKKEHLAPMLKKALQGDEASYKSNIGAGFYPPGISLSNVKVPS
jgi:large-conductance mechanosensitive channel